MHAPSAPLTGRLLRLTVVTTLGSLTLALAVAGPAAANPFGVTRQGGDDIAALTSLTPEQARALVAKRTDATARIDTGKATLAFARGGVSFRGALMLSGLQSLDAETAAVLADYDEGPLFLDGLTELAPEAARALKQFKGGPRSYASFGRCLSLVGLETLSPEAAAELAAFGGEALFLGVTELPEAAFRSLMKFRRRLYLPRLARIPAGAAESIADYRGPGLSILGLATLSTEEARVLAGLGKRWNGRLPNVQNLSPETAAVLAGLKGVNRLARLELDGSTLSADTVRELAGFPGPVLLRGMTQAVLSDDMLAALAEYNGGGLWLGGLTAVPPELAQRLATFATKSLFLDDVTELSPEAAAALAGFPGKVSLDGLTEVSAELVRALGDLNGRFITGVTALSPQAAAAALAGFGGKGLLITGAPLADRAVQALAGFRGSSLYLIVPQLSDESVRALAAFKGDSLSLAGFEEPPAELTRLLPQFACKQINLHPWEYYLGSERPVTPADARLVAAYAGRLGKTCVLPGITGFETPDAIEIATILAAAPGSLSIPNLKRVSPRTLTALIEGKNIELPPFELIELIEEPDGGTNDDFVIPENYPTRGRRR